jgi:retron-type reverse transcriptase
MGFWDKVKRFFGGDAPPPGTFAAMPSKDLENKVRAAALDALKRRETIRVTDVAESIAPGAWTNDDLVTTANVLEALYEQRFFAPFDYSKTWESDPVPAFAYHPLGIKPAQATPPATPRAPAPPIAPRAPQQQTPPAPTTPIAPGGGAPYRMGGAPYRTPVNPFNAPGILGLTPDEMRRRALKINPYRTAWIGRTDTIPPQNDERTALIDRGLILRGLLTEQQIAEIHQVGDQWLKYSGVWQRQQKRILEAQQVAAKHADAAVQELRRQRVAQKAEKKRQAIERARKRADEIVRRRAEDIVFLGRGVSAGLADRRSNLEALRAKGLPVMSTPADVARALGSSIPRLRWLCFHADAMQRMHYVNFTVPKRSGGVRVLSAPHKNLAAAQHWVLANILEKLEVEEPAHGFVKGRSTVSNAMPHVGRDVVVNLDLSEFFPTIRFARVRGVFKRMGYSPAVATVLALLCTESPRREVKFEGATYWVAIGERALPQGACTSPAISNQVSRKIDRRLRGMAAKHGWTYTRYADDLTFSAPKGHRAEIPMMLARVRHVVGDEGFALNPKKGRVQRSGRRQSVTGIVVNSKPGVARDEVRKLRAILHGAKKTGLDAQNREGRPHFEDWLRGMIAYVSMVDRAKGEKLLAALDALTRA